MTFAELRYEGQMEKRYGTGEKVLIEIPLACLEEIDGLIDEVDSFRLASQEQYDDAFDRVQDWSRDFGELVIYEARKKFQAMANKGGEQ